MSDDTGATDAVDEREQYRRQFAEDISLIWELAGTSRMDGRVLGYLLIMDRPYISSADLAATLGASTGAVSMATRRLIDTNFIRRHSVPGDRSHYFKAEEDPWGSFLANERRYFEKEINSLDAALRWVGPDETEARVRLTNGRDYLEWVQDYHHKMLADWREHKRARDAEQQEDT
ncbi:GbsR/MarR family transcriptional regulator [Microbacterium sp. zg.Y909]|uniref:GbsR/MarR family transcriptional regulator n=1 Tax=Microbacterium sp. zg.Y909 TaxID=2969413 RepID=UPI00214B29B2|nr:MarR family transcriptional regulator [Microbacterium sp. zg.Y909]MCR2824721.1 MarR family transcriptional regulator [Microbacterium sp. zg.Y909]